ncbi:hypothetical protein [Roseivirga sp. 4D4]|uniref:hypothetical protein n=1 Tax=Roseivirga sp. 4D4 TaxID=1889784 RepID=UPI001112D66F|nr:hypothetical protein [Roseivirga sp. 4D4]
MMKKLFAISMGFINREPKSPFIPNPNSIYVELMRKLAYEFLNSGARIYLPYPVEMIETEEEIYDILVSSGYCLMSFDQDVSPIQVIRQSRSIVRGYGLNLFSKPGSTSDDELEVFVRCMSPYLIPFTIEDDLSQSMVFEKALQGLNKVIKQGRELPIDTRIIMAKFLEEQLHAYKTQI